MHIIILLAIVAALALLARQWWQDNPQRRASFASSVFATTLLLAIVFLAATGRLHWIVALAAAIVPFLRRILGLIRYLPFAAQLYARHKTGRQQKQQDRPQTGTSQLSITEAKEILGLSGNYTREQVIDAHRRLMQKLHPDRGGTTYLAQQLNQAREVLLNKL